MFSIVFYSFLFVCFLFGFLGFFLAWLACYSFVSYLLSDFDLRHLQNINMTMRYSLVKYIMLLKHKRLYLILHFFRWKFCCLLFFYWFMVIFFLNLFSGFFIFWRWLAGLGSTKTSFAWCICEMFFILAFPSCLWPSAVHFVLQMAHNSLWQCLKPFIGDISPVVYRRKRPNQQAYLELCHRNPDILERVLNQIPLSNSTAWNCAPMQVVKQAEEQKWSSFQTNYDQ